MKEAILAYFIILFRNLSGGTGKNHEKPVGKSDFQVLVHVVLICLRNRIKVKCETSSFISMSICLLIYCVVWCKSTMFSFQFSCNIDNS